ncbi:hypothetical protein EVAR_16518_1 [Eumeta japonica]|uniref:Uncharacterized protein n=1 Tax=Eumeta variegata TaxID=151549 RepID=A0A4C1U493_EUMVA|nr:hypothetical protein EVAR_16518_1 [Eumeta japonica]
MTNFKIFPATFRTLAGEPFETMSTPIGVPHSCIMRSESSPPKPARTATNGLRGQTEKSPSELCPIVSNRRATFFGRSRRECKEQPADKSAGSLMRPRRRRNVETFSAIPAP